MEAFSGLSTWWRLAADLGWSAAVAPPWEASGKDTWGCLQGAGAAPGRWVDNLALDVTVRTLRPGRDTLNFHVDSKMWYLGSAEMLVCRGRNEGSNLLCLMTKVADGCKIRISGCTGVACEAPRGGSQSCKAGQWECCRMADVGIWAALVEREQNSQ